MGKGVRYCLGISVFLIVIFYCVFAGGGAQSFLHIPSLLFVLGTAGGLGLAGHRGNGVCGYVASLKKHLITSGVLGTLIGVIQMMRNLGDPEAIGAGLAVTLLCPFYSIILYGFSESFVNANREK
jgi:flagellar motor component MotA